MNGFSVGLETIFMGSNRKKEAFQPTFHISTCRKSIG